MNHAGHSSTNVFTPNNDNNNDYYYLTNLLDTASHGIGIPGPCEFKTFKIIIYNRWGKIVYEDANPLFKWSGKTNDGTDCSEGVYYYVAVANGEEYHGWIELIRDNNELKLKAFFGRLFCDW